jgi:GH24 family phage-related lysozyme (muramidase)
MNDLFFIKAKRMFVYDEGVSDKLYDDRSGHQVRGSNGIITGGIGHNFEDNKLSEAVIDLLFTEDLGRAVSEAKKIFPQFEAFTENRQYALINMLFNLGASRFKNFHKMIEAIHANDWVRAGREAKTSLWYHQVKSRGTRIVKMLTDDIWPEEYE